MTYYVEAIRAPLLRGCGPGDVLAELLALGPFMVGFATLGLARLCKRLA